MCASNFMKLNVRIFSYSYTRTIRGGLSGICTQCLDTGYYCTVVKTSLVLVINFIVLLQVCMKC